MQGRFIAGTLIGAFLILAGAQSATAAEDASLSLEEVRNALDSVPDHLLVLPDAAALRSDGNSPEVVVPDTADNAVLIHGRNGTVGLSLPFESTAKAESLSDSVIAFDNGNGSWTAPVEQPGGSVQIATVIGGAAAPSEYRYELIVPDGTVLRDDDGLVSVWTPSGSMLGHSPRRGQLTHPARP